MSTPDLHLETLFVLNAQGRITSTREPGPTEGPLFALVRGRTSCKWAVREDVPNNVADELEALARNEASLVNLRDAPTHADRYRSILADALRRPSSNAGAIRESAGPAFSFPNEVMEPDGVVLVDDERLLEHNFRGWIPGEIAAGRSPVTAITCDGHPVSICFSARSSDVAAEAGVETAAAFRGRGFGPRVTAAWALAIRASGRVPLYSTSWTNHASLSVARRLGLIAYASSWSLAD